MSSRLVVVMMIAAAMATSAPAPALGQIAPQQAPPTGSVPLPILRITFKDAVDQAIQRNPSVQQAAAHILRAQGLLSQARSVTLPEVSGNVVTLAQRQVTFNGEPVTPRGQLTANLALSAPLFAPALWAQTAQAQDEVHVQQVNAADVRRQVAVATAQTYLSIIARRRVVEADARALETAKAHYDLAHQQLAAGAGSLLNELRAQQVVSADAVLVEQASIAVYRAQEALGVLVGGDGPVDTTEEPALQVPVTLQAAEAAMPDARTDVRLAAARQAAALRVWKDSWKDWLPTANGLVQPQYLQPSTFFSPSIGWRAQIAIGVPLFDAGSRRAVKTEREAAFNESQLQHEAVLRQARSDVRAENESVKSADRALADARAAADQARHVLDIVNVSFKAGAATEIEVIDAQRALLDAETSVAVTEDLLRQARLALLVALGQFPA
jgi:outer membrane protein TolC